MSNLDNKAKILNPLLVQYQAVVKDETQKLNRINEFKIRVKAFDDIKTLNEAKRLAQDILPTANEITRFYIDNAKCIIVNNDKMFRICFDTPEEFISYDFR